MNGPAPGGARRALVRRRPDAVDHRTILVMHQGVHGEDGCAPSFSRQFSEPWSFRRSSGVGVVRTAPVWTHVAEEGQTNRSRIGVPAALFRWRLGHGPRRRTLDPGIVVIERDAGDPVPQTALRNDSSSSRCSVPLFAPSILRTCACISSAASNRPPRRVAVRMYGMPPRGASAVARYSACRPRSSPVPAAGCGARGG